MNLTREETETVILTNAASDEWDFWTLDSKYVRRLTKLGWTFKKDHQGGWSCRIPLEKITIRSARTGKRKVSESTIRALQAGMRSKRLSTDREIPGQDPPAMVG